jgi:hypothetical protein
VYPRLGDGQVYGTLAADIIKRGSTVATGAAWLDQLENLLPIGRSGMFKYNNQDHAIATGLLAARTALGKAKFDPWCVNIDAEYSEGSSAA